MKLYLLRHADAEPHRSYDATRELTAKGIEQAKAAGKFCRNHDIVPDLILSSPFRRAEQTANHCAKAISADVTLADFLASGMEPETALAELGGYTKFNSLMIVGHEPDFSRLAATLLRLPSCEHIHLRKASLTLLTVAAFHSGAATLEFSLPPTFFQG